MKYKKKLERLAKRREAFNKSQATTKGYKRPGSVNKCL